MEEKNDIERKKTSRISEIKNLISKEMHFYAPEIQNFFKQSKFISSFTMWCFFYNSKWLFNLPGVVWIHYTIELLIWQNFFLIPFDIACVYIWYEVHKIVPTNLRRNNAIAEKKSYEIKRVNLCIRSGDFKKVPFKRKYYVINRASGDECHVIVDDVHVLRDDTSWIRKSAGNIG